MADDLFMIAEGSFEFEMGDGSRFSLHEFFRNVDDVSQPRFVHTSVTGFVGGRAYYAKIEQPAASIDEGSILENLLPMPEENIFPRCPPEFLRAPVFNAERHYLKSPSFEADDAEAGQTLVADCVLAEATTYELLRNKPHDHIAKYLGCVVEDGRITHICLQRYPKTLFQRVEEGISTDRSLIMIGDLESALHHLHTLRRAHNDVNPSNICVDEAGNAILTDLDSCIPLGQPLLKGVSTAPTQVSDVENDYDALDEMIDWFTQFELYGVSPQSDEHARVDGNPSNG